MAIQKTKSAEEKPHITLWKKISTIPYCNIGSCVQFILKEKNHFLFVLRLLSCQFLSPSGVCGMYVVLGEGGSMRVRWGSKQASIHFIIF